MRYVLRYTGGGVAPEADVARVRAVPGAAIVEAARTLLLVEAEPERLREVVDGLEGWTMAPERQHDLPDARERVEDPPR